jgi:hypothetical protein
VKQKGLPRGCRVRGAQGADGNDVDACLGQDVAIPRPKHQACVSIGVATPVETGHGGGMPSEAGICIGNRPIKVSFD